MSGVLIELSTFPYVRKSYPHFYGTMCTMMKTLIFQCFSSVNTQSNTQRHSHLSTLIHNPYMQLSYRDP